MNSFRLTLKNVAVSFLSTGLRQLAASRCLYICLLHHPLREGVILKAFQNYMARMPAKSDWCQCTGTPCQVSSLVPCFNRRLTTQLMLSMKFLNTVHLFSSFFFLQTALVCIAVTEITYFLGYRITAVLHYTFCIAIPIYPLLGCLICFIKVGLLGVLMFKKHKQCLTFDILVLVLKIIFKNPMCQLLLLDLNVINEGV